MNWIIIPGLVFGYFSICFILVITPTAVASLGAQRIRRLVQFSSRLKKIPEASLKTQLRSGSIPISHIGDGSVNSSFVSKYPGRIVVVQCKQFPLCDIFLCGILHVSHNSIELVKDAVTTVRPDYVVLELCEERLFTLEELDSAPQDIKFSTIVSSMIKQRNFGKLSMDLLCWLQQKVGKLVGSKVGGEQYAASKSGHSIGASIILGDRSYSITVQRMMERLSKWEKCKIAVMLVWEVLTCSARRVSEYLKNSEADSSFVKDELEQLSKYFPSLADVLINERDEYLAQTISQVAQQGFLSGPTVIPGVQTDGSPFPHKRRSSIVAVLGAAHLPGVEARLRQGCVSPERIREISRSSKQQVSSWPGEGMLHAVNTTSLYRNIQL